MKNPKMVENIFNPNPFSLLLAITLPLLVFQLLIACERLI